jgi:hypothetical protein
MTELLNCVKKAEKWERWTETEEEKLVKWYDLYPKDTVGLMHDHLPDRTTRQIVTKYRQLHNTGQWEVILKRMKVKADGIKTIIENHVEKVYESLCTTCQHAPVCKDLAHIQSTQFFVKVGVIECKNYDKGGMKNG